MPIKMKVCNTAEYNESLKKRGRIFYLFDEAIKVWFYNDEKKKERTKFIYSDRLIEILAVFRYLLKLPYRQLEGLLAEYIECNGLQLPVPDYTTLCRRIRKPLSLVRDHRSKSKLNDNAPIDVLIDSTGINIYHTGGGHSKENGKSRCHTHYDQFRKLHVALDPEKKQVISMKVTHGKTMDGTVAPTLIKNISQRIRAIYADAAYDRIGVRKACAERQAKQIIPPSINAVLRKTKKSEPSNLWSDRNAAVKKMRQYEDAEEGRNQWKKDQSYGRRSLVEAFFGRFKAIFGFHFMSRNEQAREAELIIKTRILNSFTDLGGAVFKRVA